MLREIVLDTETTGTDHAKGDRVIEIGCVELLNHIPTGKIYHVYINPEFPVSPGAFAVHGLSNEFLADKPVFAAIADEFADFIGDARLVIHNAAFDIGFLNAEFARTGHRPFKLADAVDTLVAGPAQASGRREQPRCALLPLRHRQFQAHQARRASRCRDPGRGLYRADRRPAGRLRPVDAARARGRRLRRRKRPQPAKPAPGP